MPQDFGAVPMKTIDMSTKASAKAYLSRPPEDTHNEAELSALHRAIQYTKTYMQAESLSKMDEEEMISRPVPRLI